MADLDQAAELIRALQGAPLTILFAMLVLRRPLGPDELARLTGYNRKTVSRGLNQLKSMGLATRTQRYYGWQLTDKGYQLPLIGLQTLSLPDSSEGEFLPLADISPVDNSPTLSQGDSSEGEFVPLADETLTLRGTGSPVEGEFLPLALMNHDMNDRDNIKEILLFFSFIDSPTRERLAALPHVTAHYARGFREYHDRGEYPEWVRSRVGWLVKLIENGDEPPTAPQKETEKAWYTPEEFENYIEH